MIKSKNKGRDELMKNKINNKQIRRIKMKQKWSKEEVGGSYFHPKIDNQIITSVLLRDCRVLNNGCDYNYWKNGCDYELIVNTKDGLSVNPIFKEWIDNDMVSYWIEQEGR